MHAVTREQRIRRVIARVGLRQLTADARRLAPDLPPKRAAELRRAVDAATDDAGVAVWEWYEEHDPVRLTVIADGQWL